MESASSNNEATVWAVVDSGTRRLVGQVPKETKPGDIVTVHEAFELNADVTRLPAGPQGQTAALFSPSMVPVDIEREPVDVLCLVANIRFFSDMKSRGREYEMMYQDLIDQLVQARARAANIATPGNMGGHGGMPPGMGGPGGMPFGPGGGFGSPGRG